MGARSRRSWGRPGPTGGGLRRATSSSARPEEWLAETLHAARHGELVIQNATGVSFAEAAAEWLRYIEFDRERKPGMVKGYRWIVNSQLLPAFGSLPIEALSTEMIEDKLGGTASSRQKALVLLHGILKRARKKYGLKLNAAADVEKPPLKRSGDIQVYSPEEVWALVRAAASELDAAIYLTAAFTGLRMGELLALRWREVDFAGSLVRVRASYYAGALTTPKSGKVRAVPLAPDVAKVLAQLSRRELFTDDDDLVFAGETGSYLDGSALRRRYKVALAEARLRPLRFHDLRHTFGTRMIAKADIRRVQEWMGHADIQTTMRYLHFAPREEDARLVAEAFALSDDVTLGDASGIQGDASGTFEDIEVTQGDIPGQTADSEVA